jgi:hypothetical protein
VENKTFTYQFPDGSPRSVNYECGNADRLATTVEDGVPFVYANRAGMLTLAKLLIQLSLGEYKNGFHIHLRADFGDDASKPDVLTILLNETEGQ